MDEDYDYEKDIYLAQCACPLCDCDEMMIIHVDQVIADDDRCESCRVGYHIDTPLPDIDWEIGGEA